MQSKPAAPSPVHCVLSLFGGYGPAGVESRAIARGCHDGYCSSAAWRRADRLTAPVNTYSHLQQENLSGWFWLTLLHEVRPALIIAMVGTLFLSWPIVRAEFIRGLLESEPRSLNWLPWLISHLLLVAGLYAMTALGRAGAIPTDDTGIWLSLWMAVALAASATWAATVLPLQFWVRWLARCRMTLLAGAALGVAADLFGRSTQALCPPRTCTALSSYTRTCRRELRKTWTRWGS